MRIEEKNPFISIYLRFGWFALFAVSVFGLISCASGQTLTTLYSFTNYLTGSYPEGGLIVSGDTLYGATTEGGNDPNAAGMLFKLTTGGTGFTNFHTFTYTGTDASDAYACLLLSGNTLYGTTRDGGVADHGTVFRINTDGTGFTNLHSFVGSEGRQSRAKLVLSGNILYGTTVHGGSADEGTVFAINTDGTGFKTLHVFTGSDGSEPWSEVVISGNALYGTAAAGGNGNSGVIYKMNLDGGNFTNLYKFTGRPDGASPYAGVVLSGNTLSGTAQGGGDSDYSGDGTVFSIQTDGTGFVVLHTFTAGDGSTNVDGRFPQGFTLSGNTLYGVTSAGGILGEGCVFAMNTDGTGFTNLYNFAGPDGANPYSFPLLFYANKLYGTTVSGGSSNFGSIFSLALPLPALTVRSSATNLVICWPTNATNLSLQFATNLVPPVIWNSNLPLPTIVNGLNTVTNPMTGGQKFFRLSQ
jgi:uncharacterized repeat protein (TIGR03803 family)